MKQIFSFGEQVMGYEVNVFNEREVRASAGILFFGAIMSSLNAFYTGDTTWMKWFITIFLIEFSIRLFVNPRFAPTMILGRFAVSKQTPEYAGAIQKKFAWGLAWAIAATMFVFVVVFGLKGPIVMTTCIMCLSLMFFETAFGICLGCKMHQWFMKEQPTLCPGGACEMKRKHDIQRITKPQLTVLSVFLLVLIALPLMIH